MTAASEPDAMDAAYDTVLKLFRGGSVAVLTGAGISTESGIPDYRGPGTLKRARAPMRFSDYVATPENRARYWARSMVGWKRFSRAEPNDGHRALATLESEGALAGLITQNVDRLHRRAGHPAVIELHGALEETRCLKCGVVESRHTIQRELLELNPHLRDRADELAPDGDALLPDELLHDFVIPTCHRCGGTMKPNVVFFGENVPKPTVDAAYDVVDKASSLVVIGSSLAVFSGLRFVHRARDRNIPVAVINLGETRGDTYATACLHRASGAALTAIVRELSSTR